MFELVAEGGQTFPVSKYVLAAQSMPLRSAATGPWSESQERKINLQDWDGETVERLVRFLCTSDYPNPLRTEPLSRIFLAHAKVYALAQYKDVEALKTLSLARLKSSLVNGNTIEPAAFIELARYVYSNTDSLEDTGEPMRQVVSEFAASNYENLQTEDMALLVREEVDFRFDLQAERKLYAERAERHAVEKRLKDARLEVENLKRKVALLEAEFGWTAPMYWGYRQ